MVTLLFNTLHVYLRYTLIRNTRVPWWWWSNHFLPTWFSNHWIENQCDTTIIIHCEGVWKKWYAMKYCKKFQNWFFKSYNSTWLFIKPDLTGHFECSQFQKTLHSYSKREINMQFKVFTAMSVIPVSWYLLHCFSRNGKLSLVSSSF